MQEQILMRNFMRCVTLNALQRQSCQTVVRPFWARAVQSAGIPSNTLLRRSFQTSAPKHEESVSSSKAPRQLPKWAAKYADRFKNNPASHVTSFLILHELTAVLPLPILFWFFHSFEWTPESESSSQLALLIL